MAYEKQKLTFSIFSFNSAEYSFFVSRT